MKKVIEVADKQFELFVERELIEREIKRVAEEINRDMKGRDPLFVVLLNGAFMFAGELLKQITVPCEIDFVRLESYNGMESVGEPKKIIGLNSSVRDRSLIIVEDIVDSGRSMTCLLEELENYRPKEVRIATMLLKPTALKCDLKPDYVGLELPADFILGWGLDYKGYGRNLTDIYRYVE